MNKQIFLNLNNGLVGQSNVAWDLVQFFVVWGLSCALQNAGRLWFAH